jgi:hypothetical protein
MKAGRVTGAALVVLFGCSGALAEPCAAINRQIYNLVADTVNWSIRVGGGQKCRYGIRYAKVQLDRMTLVSPPGSGQVVLEGSAFTYVPKQDFQGDDSFDLEVAGQIQKIRGASKIHVVVSVRSATRSPEAPQAAALVPIATPHKAGQTGLVPSFRGPTPPIKDALGPGLVPTLPLLGAAPVPVPQLGSGPMPVPMPPQPDAAPGPTPPVPTASSAAPPSLSLNPARSP